MSNGNKEFYVGVDLGGTKILAGIFSLKMELIGVAKISTKATRGAEAVMDRIVRCIYDAVDESDLSLKQVKGIGVGAPGAVDPETGVVIFAPNLDWHDVELQKELNRRLDVAVVAGNDCNVSTLGVYEKEFNSKPRNLLGIFLGTGIGGGLILNRELFLGCNYSAGELGHMVLDPNGPQCECGNKGCFEALASRTAIFARIHSAIEAGRKTVLTEILGPDLSNLRSGDLRRAIRRGDELVAAIVEEAAVYTGIATGNLINIFSPEVVVLGGGVIEALGCEMMPTIEKVAREHVLDGTFKRIQITASKLGDYAGITGAAILARTKWH